jgi:tRNA A-37 threonylcarbamoyl transferase component Bud32
LPPPSIPGYVIERQIGRGGSATVYLARERKHDRPVAVKVLHAALAASLQSARFLREIEIIARLAHPNILPLLDSGRVGELLYYVTPYLAGESLRARMEREGQLAPGDAVRLAREVAEGLDYAHRQGVVHRDVKPENILLADGHALVADFGIARAVSAASDDRLTTGMVPGTPRYMSPEQIEGTAEVDGRSDIYSLACVLYELLAGAPPFTGETPQQVVAKHLSAPVPLLRAVAPRVPAAVERAVTIALAKTPSDRFATALGFAEALLDIRVSSRQATNAGISIGTAVPAPVARVLLAVAAVALAAWVLVESGIAVGSVGRVRDRLGFGEPTLDTAAYVAVPLDAAVRASTSIDVVSLLRAGLMRWRDIVVEDESRVAEAGQRLRASPADRARRIAVALGAGRYARVEVATAEDSVDVSVTLFDTRTNRRLKTSAMHFAAEPRAARVAMAALADSLVFREGIVPPSRGGISGTTSLFARQAYVRGHLAVAEGRFARADTEFFRAARHDPEFAQAMVWLAQVRSWVHGSSGIELWRHLTSQALAKRSGLPPDDSVRLDALAAFASSDAARACALWRELTVSAPSDFTSWYSLGTCLRRDNAVVRSASNPTHWQFRSSIHESVTAYERAFRLQPSVLHAFGGRGLTDLQLIMFTSGARLRTGRALSPDTTQFTGYPVWRGDSLACTPLLRNQSRLAPLPDAVGEGVQHQRLRFRDLATMWRAELPNSVEGAEAMAVAMEMLGDPAALDTLQQARAAARDAADRLRIAVNEVWLRVKFSLPSNLAGLRGARALADSILWTHAVAPGEEAVGSLAALTGRAQLAAMYARMGVGDETLPAIARNGPALLAFAALGGPPDSLRNLERVVAGAIQSLPLSSRDAGRRDWLTRAASLAFPDYQFTSLPTGGETGLRLGNLVAASLGEDRPRVRQMLSDISAARRSLRPADIMPDGLLPEAAALTRIGDVSGAITRLDPTLGTIRFTASQDLTFIHSAGSLVRVMVLRADLAHQAGDDDTARVWARAVVELWSAADPFLQPTVQRMQQLAR